MQNPQFIKLLHFIKPEIVMNGFLSKNKQVYIAITNQTNEKTIIIYCTF